MTRHDTLKPSTTILKTDRAVLMRGSTPFSIYNCSFSLPFMAASLSTVALMPRAQKVQCSQLLYWRHTEIKQKRYRM